MEKNDVIQVRLSAEQKSKLKELAGEEGVSEYVRRLIFPAVPREMKARATARMESRATEKEMVAASLPEPQLKPAFSKQQLASLVMEYTAKGMNLPEARHKAMERLRGKS